MAIAAIIISIVGLGLTFIEIMNFRAQLVQMERQARATLVSSKRMKTVELIIEWNNSVEKIASFVEQIVGKFSEEQCIKLDSKEPFTVSQEIKEDLCDICPSATTDYCKNICKSATGNFIVKGLQLNELRSAVIKYLNNLEVVMLAWKHKIVDSELIEEQYTCFYDIQRKRDALQNFRNIAGNGKSYPSIECFINEVKEKINKSNIVEPRKDVEDML